MANSSSPYITHKPEVRTFDFNRRPSATETLPSPVEVRAIIDGKSVPFATVAEKFNALVDAWDEFNLGRSVMRFDSIAYTQIIGMGRDAVPFLLDRMRKGNSDWAFALKMIAGHDVETDEMEGDEQAIIAAWLAWGGRHGDGRRG